MFSSNPSCTQAMILAAGRGLRFRPVTDTMPKPLVTLGGMALIDWQITSLISHGITRIVINACYKADMLEAYVHDQTYDADIIFSKEEIALETGGGIKRALAHFNNNPFFAVNSDVVLHPQHDKILTRLLRACDVRPSTQLALLLHPTSSALGIRGAGDFFSDEYGAIWRRGAQRSAPYYFTGVQLMHPTIFDGVDDSIFSMNLIYDKLLHASPNAITGVIGDGIMLHAGDPEGHAACEQYLHDHADNDSVETQYMASL